MTYFGFLWRFLLIPILILLGLTFVDQRAGREIKGFKGGSKVWLAIGLHVLVAVLYTTPWDNYLVATGVWYYNPALVTGVVIGWVPVEEYTFFVLETILSGLWWWFLARRLSPPKKDFLPNNKLRFWSTGIVFIFWLIFTVTYFSSWKPGTYLSIVLFWALPAILPQMLFGADILWQHRKLVSWTILPIALYLSAMDLIAISSGTWTIDPAQSTGIFLGGLPIEEAVFFLLTNLLIGFGITLLLAGESQTRLDQVRCWLKTRIRR
jgi:lycopene cyclase domain-containing protein